MDSHSLTAAVFLDALGLMAVADVDRRAHGFSSGERLPAAPDRAGKLPFRSWYRTNLLAFPFAGREQAAFAPSVLASTFDTSALCLSLWEYLNSL